MPGGYRRWPAWALPFYRSSMTTLDAPRAPWRLGVDVGGTFTDLVLADAQGRSWVAKVPSVPSDPSRGVLAALERIAAELELSVEV